MVIAILEILPEFSYSFAPVIELDQAHLLFEFFITRLTYEVAY